MQPLPYTVSRPSNACVRVTTPYKLSPKWEQWFLLRSDVHFDNKHCRRDLVKDHHHEAIERNAGIIDGGDFYCLMQGVYDKRQSKSALRPEHGKSDDYFDLVTDTTTDWHKQTHKGVNLARNLITIGRGNHESSVIKRNQVNMTNQLTKALRRECESPVQGMGYGYYVQFRFQRNGKSQTITLKCYHGSGGGGPVTRDVIKSNRMAVYTHDADIVMTGHTHDAWTLPIQREKLTQQGHVYTLPQWYVKCPSYKDEYGDGTSGWHIERGGPPKPLGAHWLRFFCPKNGGRGAGKPEIAFELIPAIEYYPPAADPKSIAQAYEVPVEDVMREMETA